MNSVNLNNAPMLNTAQTNTQKSQNTSQETYLLRSIQPIESSSVSISDKSKALFSANATPIVPESKSLEPKASGLTSFTYGALGLDNPEVFNENKENTSYAAGQYLKGALTVGTILLAVV